MIIICVHCTCAYHGCVSTKRPSFNGTKLGANPHDCFNPIQNSKSIVKGVEPWAFWETSATWLLNRDESWHGKNYVCLLPFSLTCHGRHIMGLLEATFPNVEPDAWTDIRCVRSVPVLPNPLDCHVATFLWAVWTRLVGRGCQQLVSIDLPGTADASSMTDMRPLIIATVAHFISC